MGHHVGTTKEFPSIHTDPLVERRVVRLKRLSTTLKHPLTLSYAEQCLTQKVMHSIKQRHKNGVETAAVKYEQWKEIL